MTRIPTVDRAITAIVANHVHDVRQSFNELNREGCWREFFTRVAQVPNVSPVAQENFLTWWAQLGWAVRIHQIKDDNVLLDGLWKLLPPYAGTPIDLYRGQGRNEKIGASWTSSLMIARKFALYGTRLLEMYDDRGDPSPAILEAEVRRKGLTARADAVVLAARQVTAAHIICAPCLHGHDYEDEYIVDPRGLTTSTVDTV
jgi:hypothetical protein